MTEKPQAEVGADQIDAEEAREAASVRLLPPSDEAARAGVALCFRWAIPDAGVQVKGDVKRGPTGLVITRVEIDAPVPTGITRNLLRVVPVGDVLALARANLMESDQPHGPAIPISAPSTSGRTLMTDHLLRDVALLYIQETAPGKERGATQRMVEHLGRPQGTVQTWIKRARKEGWLMPGPTGRMGAEPGPRLLNWYASMALSGNAEFAELENEVRSTFPRSASRNAGPADQQD